MVVVHSEMLSLQPRELQAVAQLIPTLGIASAHALTSHSLGFGYVCSGHKSCSLISPFTLPTELGGRKGPEPVRFGDWERKGIAVDFYPITKTSLV